MSFERLEREHVPELEAAIIELGALCSKISESTVPKDAPPGLHALSYLNVSVQTAIQFLSMVHAVTFEALEEIYKEHKEAEG